MSVYDSCSSNSSSRSSSNGSSSGGENFPAIHKRHRDPMIPIMPSQQQQQQQQLTQSLAHGRQGGGSETLCAVCHLPVTDERSSVKTFEGSTLHRECFVCSTCGKPLEIKKNSAAEGIDEIIEGGNVATYGTDLNGKYFCVEHLRSSKPSAIEYKELKSGYLYKQGRVVKNWKRRFFVLLSDMKQLRYYQKDSDNTTTTTTITNSLNNSSNSITNTNTNNDNTVCSSSSLSSSSSSMKPLGMSSPPSQTAATPPSSPSLPIPQQPSEETQQQQQQSQAGTPLLQVHRSVPIPIKHGSQGNGLATSPGSMESSSYESPTGSPSGGLPRRGVGLASPRKPQKPTKNRGFIELGEGTEVVPASFSLRGVAGCPEGSCIGFQIITKDRVWNLVCLDESERSSWINAIKYVISLPQQQQITKRKRIYSKFFN